MRRVLLWVCGVAIAVIGIAAANLRPDAGRIEVDWQLFRPSPPVVIVAQPTRGPIARTVAAKGVIEPIRQVQVVAKVSGKVAVVHVEEGSAVHKGDLLFQLDDASYRTRADSARTRLDTAKSNLGIAETHLRDIEKDPAAATTAANPTPSVNPMANLAGLPTPPQTGPTKLEAAKTSVDGWKRERKAAETADESARADLDRTAIRAAIDGVVEDLAVEVGDDVVATPAVSLVTPAAPIIPRGMFAGLGGNSDDDSTASPALPGPARALCALLDPDQVRVRAWIDEADVALVAANQPTRIFLPDEPAVPVLGRISRVAPRGRPTGEVVTYAATIEFTGARRRPRVGMRVNVEVEVSREANALGVPVQAVAQRKRRDLERPSGSRSSLPEGKAERSLDSEYVKSVFVLDGAGRVRLRAIETGLSDERRVAVVAGLSTDDRVVVGPFRALDTLEDGMVIQVEAEPLEDAVSLSQGPGSSPRRPTR